MNFTNIISEEYLLGSILIDPETNIMKLRGDGITSATFTTIDHKRVWNIASQFYDSNKIGSIEMMEFEPEVRGLETASSLAVTIGSLRGKARGSAHIDQHVITLKGFQATRMAYSASQEAMDMIEAGDSPEVVIGEIQDKLLEAMATMTSAKPWKTAKEITNEMKQIVNNSHNPSASRGFTSGLPLLDHHTGGLEPDQFWVVAAPPSCGKTLLMLQIVNAFLSAGKHVLAFSFETSAGKISLRNMCNNMEISANSLAGKQGEKMSGKDISRFKRGIAEMIEKDNLTICDDYDMTMETMMAIAAMRKKMGFEIDLIMVDYIQLVDLSNNGGKNREQQVAEISRSLKKMSKQHNCPLITASQLNDDGKTRESRAILQDADILLNIDPKEDCIYIAKNRDGERGAKLPYTMNGDYQRFEERHEPIKNRKY